MYIPVVDKMIFYHCSYRILNTFLRNKEQLGIGQSKWNGRMSKFYTEGENTARVYISLTRASNTDKI